MGIKILRRVRVGLALGALAVACFVLGIQSAPAAVRALNYLEQLTAQETVFASVYEQLSPSIVSIAIAEPFNNGAFEEVSGGSGFVYDKQGHIITNYHVVGAMTRRGRVEVNFVDGTIVRAQVVGGDANSDLAVLKVDVDESRLFPVRFGDSDALVIGQMTLALGSPFGQRWTMTSGIISGLDRTITGLNNYQVGAVIQTDAAINPGNSGGPLLNLNGEVLGVNSQIISEDRSNSGIAFAVPSALVQRVVPELIANGRADYAYLGVEAIDINLDVIEAFRIPNDTKGVVVVGFGLRNGASPAQAGGLQANDIITAVNGVPMNSFGTLIAYLSTYTAPDESVEVTVLRNRQLLNLNVVLGRR